MKTIRKVPTAVEVWYAQKSTHRLREWETKWLSNYSLLHEWQLTYRLKRYLENTEYPSMREFRHEVDATPDTLVPEPEICAAYLCGDMVMSKLAYQYETLECNWFPTYESEQELKRLKGVLRVAFPVK